MAEAVKKEHLKNRKSRVLWEITLMVVVVYLIGGLAAFLIAQNSYSRLSQKSTDKLVEEKAQTISSSYDYLMKAETDTLFNKYDVASIDRIKLYQNLLAGDVNNLDPLQVYLDAEMKGMVEQGLLGLKDVFMIIPPNPLSGKSITLASNDPGKVFMTMPPAIAEAIEEEDNWIILYDGIPEMGLQGEQLVTFARVASPISSDVVVTVMGISPMSEDVAEIRQFYDDEKKSTMVSYALLTLVSVAIIMLLTFFVLRLLIRKRITEPIDILSAEAGEIMEGNLDIDVVVHEGGEFQGLETAFKKMVESFRAYIAKSTGEN